METKKIESYWLKVGRLKMTVAQKAKCRCANIYVSERYLKHIHDKHRKELETLGFGELEYVKMIATNFNEIRKGSGTSILLIVRTNVEIHHTAAIDLNYNAKKGFWEVKTAQPRRTEEIKKKEMLCKLA